MKDKKLIYILNSYSEKESSHFAHVIHLLKTMADKGIKIALIIEKLHGELVIEHQNISIHGLTSKNKLLRLYELFNKVKNLIKLGYDVSFIRISAWATIISSIAHYIYGGRSYLWQSGTTHEHDWSRAWDYKKFKWLISSYLPNWLARKLTHRFVTGPNNMVDYYANVVKIPKEKIRLLYNDIDLSRFNRNKFPYARKDILSKYNLEENSKIILLVHRLSPVRRTLVYLEPLFEELSKKDNWSLIIVGGGEELPIVKKMSKDFCLESRIIFLGEIPNQDISKLYAGADIFIHPTYTEGFPRVIIEAMALGLPIITTDAGGTAELLGPKQSKYVTSKIFPRDFSLKVIDLLEHTFEWDELSRENLELVHKFSTDNVSDMYIMELFKDE